jgi:hypothetical protein
MEFTSPPLMEDLWPALWGASGPWTVVDILHSPDQRKAVVRSDRYHRVSSVTGIMRTPALPIRVWGYLSATAYTFDSD